MSKTGNEFIDFSDCDATTEAEVVVSLVRFRNGLQAYASDDLEFITDLKQQAPRMHVAISVGAVKKSTVVHEFGHVLGLGHEHERAEAPHDKACDGLNPSHLEPQLILPRGYYDNNSVMNYCYLLRHTNAGLSPGDIAALEHLYVRKNPEMVHPLELNIDIDGLRSLSDKKELCSVAFSHVEKLRENCVRDKKITVEGIRECSERKPWYYWFKPRFDCMLSTR